MAVEQWFTVPTVEDMRALLATHADLLLTDEASTRAQARRLSESPETWWRLGLLTLSEMDGTLVAFDWLAEPNPSLLPDDQEESARKALARSRVRAGVDPDSAEAAYHHAIAALANGHDDEAEHAIARCGQQSTSWERTDWKRSLSQLARARPTLSAGYARLRRILSHD